MEPREPASVRQRAPGRGRAEGILALLVVQLCFGLSPLFAKWALAPRDGLAPRALVAWRILFGAFFLGALAAWKHPREVLPPWRELPRLALCALLGIALNMWLYLEGVTRASVVHTGLLVTQIPVFTYAVACLAGAERVQLRRVCGIALALGGALLLVLARTPAGGPEGSALGNLLLVSNCLAYAIYLVLARGLLQRFPTLVVIAWVFWCALPALPFLLRGVAPWPEELSTLPVAGIAYTLFFGTFLAYLLNAVALARVPASTVAIFIFLQPLVAGAAGVLVLDERISLAELGAAAALLAGITLVAWEGSRKRGGTKESSQRRAGRVFHSRR
jgi:drug/metabolite transporter (DMT)-like permease